MILAGNVCDFWRQKSRAKWMEKGDTNSKFFFSLMQAKRLKLQISRSKNSEGIWLQEPTEISNEGQKIFSLLYKEELENTQYYSSELKQVLRLIPKILNDQDNIILESWPSLEEVRKAVFDLDPESSAGPDGFTGKFFQECWGIVGTDVYRAVLDFFSGGSLPKAFSATLLVLIPKNDNPQSFSEYRPISLCNFCYKILSKLLAKRLEVVLAKIISPQQSGFVKGRLISDNILLAQEMIGHLNSKVRGGNVAIKLDMEKAYDRMSWFFLISVLRKFGFGEQWIDRIWRLISNCNFSIVINGELQGFFPSTRGLRQGDPLSPALFIIAADVFSRLLNSLLHSPMFQPYNTSGNGYHITHLAYADDVIIFTSGDRRSLRRVMEKIRKYEAASGQRVNRAKSCFLLGNKHTDALRIRVSQITGFGYQSLPMKYLGCPLYLGRKSKNLFQELVDKIVVNINGWSRKLLSHGGRIVLLQTILYSFPIHLITVLQPPIGVINTIERIFSDFLWGSSDFGRKHHWRKWEDVCYPVEE